MEFQEFLFRLAAAVLSGFLIGLEREMMNKDAGLRTNMMVSIGAAVYVMISFQFLKDEPSSSARIIGQIITGIGFLGAGVIIRRDVRVKGLTTAATIRASSAMGCLAGLGMFKELMVCTFLIMIVNRGAIYVEKITGGIKSKKDIK